MPVDAFAIASAFAVRNPKHEARAREIVAQATGKPATLQNVVCGVTYFYSNRESLELDWSVLEHVGQLFADLKFEREAQGTAAEREIHAGRARDLTAEIVRVTFELASQRLIAGAASQSPWHGASGKTGGKSWPTGRDYRLAGGVAWRDAAYSHAAGDRALCRSPRRGGERRFSLPSVF